MNADLPVAEQFFSVQGEGPNAGTPAVFLRLFGCNLMCGGEHNRDIEKQEDMYPSDDATWVCDTISVWRSPENVYTPVELIDEWKARGWWENLVSNGTHLILTGGEPMLPGNQNGILALITEILKNRKRGLPYIEVETNGTIEPKKDLLPYINLYNVSVKLSNSGMSEDRRLNPNSMEFHSGNKKSMFKFVVSQESDVDEIRSIISDYDIPEYQISLMPAGATQEDLSKTRSIVAELCKDTGWEYSPRMQVNIWNEATGV